MFPFYKTFACFAVGVVALAAVEAGQLHEQVLDKLERKLDEQFVGSIDASRLTGTLLWGFTAHDVEVRDGRGELVAHIEEFQVGASAFELLDGNLRFDQARFVRPVVLIEQYADGRKNIEEVFRSRRPSKGSKPPGEILFEMSRAEIVDGQLVNVDPVDPMPATALVYPSGHKTAMHVTSSRAINLEGSFQVRSGKQTTTVIDRLDAEVSPDASPRSRQLSVQRAQIDSDAGALRVRVDGLVVDDHWRLDDLVAFRPGKFAADAGRVALHGRASSANGGWLEARGYINRDDQSYDFAAMASDFEPSDWPGAPDWSWLVIDGVGEVSGRGWTSDAIDASVRWTSHDLDLAGEQIDRLDVVARVADQRVEVETLDVALDGLTANAHGQVSKDGGFALDLDTRIDAAFAKRLAEWTGAGQLLVQLRKVARFELTSKVSGTLDLTGRGLKQLVEEAKADISWKARDVILDETRLDVAGGTLRVNVPTAARNQRTNRRFTYKLSTAFHDLHHGPFSADILRTSMRGNGVFDAGAGLEGLNYRLEVDGDGVGFSEMQAKAIRLRLSGALSPSDRGAEWPIENLAAKGTLDLVDYLHDDVSAKRVATNIDVSGAFPAGEGTIVAHATGLRTPDRRFRHAKMELNLLEGQKFRLKSKARVEISLIPDLPMYLDVSGRHARNLAALSLDKFSVGRPGMRWKTREPGLVRFADGAVILQSLMLHRRSQRVRLDGEFGRGKSGSISDICKRLTSAQIRSFFDLSSIF